MSCGDFPRMKVTLYLCQSDIACFDVVYATGSSVVSALLWAPATSTGAASLFATVPTTGPSFTAGPEPTCCREDGLWISSIF